MDQSQDISARQLNRLHKMVEFPGFVKSANLEEQFGEDLPSHAFASPIKRLFPCHTAAATWLSAAYLLNNQEKVGADREVISKAIDRFAEIHGITGSIQKLRQDWQAHNSVTKEAALSDDIYGLVLTNPDGTVSRHYPLRNVAEVVKAAEYLQNNRDSFPYVARKQFAEKILSRANTLGANINGSQEFLSKQAGYGMCSAETCAKAIFNRVQASRRSIGGLTPIQENMIKLAQTVLSRPSLVREPGVLQKMAEVVDDFDRFHKIRGLPAVEDVFFVVTGEKLASFAKDYCETTTGNLYKLADVELLKLNDIREQLGDDYADELSADGLRVSGEKAAAIVPTMPRDDAATLDRLLQEVGVQPMLKQAGSAFPQVTTEFLQQL